MDEKYLCYGDTVADPRMKKFALTRMQFVRERSSKLDNCYIDIGYKNVMFSLRDRNPGNILRWVR